MQTALAQERQGRLSLRLYGLSADRRVLLATNNPDKLREFGRLLRGSGCEIIAPSQLDIQLSTVENGYSYAENATMKALEGIAASGLTTLADDSGLEIDAMDGAPGYLSARFLGEAASYEERFRVILGKLKGLPPEQRGARFRCVVAVAAPGEPGVRLAEGVCAGVIAHEPRGSGGFGYDPIFYLPELGRTMAELSAEAKDKVSHRGMAVRAVLPMLREII